MVQDESFIGEVLLMSAWNGLLQSEPNTPVIQDLALSIQGVEDVAAFFPGFWLIARLLFRLQL